MDCFIYLQPTQRPDYRARIHQVILPHFLHVGEVDRLEKTE